MELKIQFRKWQQEFFDNRKRFNVLLCHRRSGKTVAAVFVMILESLQATSTRPQFAFLAPEAAQGEKIVWGYFKEYLKDMPGVTLKESKSEIHFAHNNATISVIGLRNLEAIRGRYFNGIIIDEYSDAPRNAWGSVLYPALVDKKGWAIVMGTVKGNDQLWELYTKIQTTAPENWYSKRLTVYDSGVFSELEIEGIKNELSTAQFNQEFLVDPDADFSNKYYLELVNRANEQGRVGSFAYNPKLPVFTAWDLGRDGTAIWFAQIERGEIRFIDYWQKVNCKLGDAVQVVLNKGYIYKTHFLPHDSGQNRIDSYASIYQQVWDLTGMQPIKLDRIAVSLGISMAQTAFTKCKFNVELCGAGLNCLRNYQAKVDKNLQIMLDQPVHDQFSHGSDAFRYMIQGLTMRKFDNGSRDIGPLKFDSSFNALDIL